MNHRRLALALRGEAGEDGYRRLGRWLSRLYLSNGSAERQAAELRAVTEAAEAME